MDGKPIDGSCRVAGPFHLSVDRQDRIWITNGNADTVTRFPADDPGKAELLKVGLSPKGIAIDNRGNAWVNNFIGDPGLREKLQLLAQKGRALGKICPRVVVGTRVAPRPPHGADPPPFIAVSSVAKSGEVRGKLHQRRYTTRGTTPTRTRRGILPDQAAGHAAGHHR